MNSLHPNEILDRRLEFKRIGSFQTFKPYSLPLSIIIVFAAVIIFILDINALIHIIAYSWDSIISSVFSIITLLAMDGIIGCVSYALLKFVNIGKTWTYEITDTYMRICSKKQIYVFLFANITEIKRKPIILRSKQIGEMFLISTAHQTVRFSCKYKTIYDIEQTPFDLLIYKQARNI